VFLTMELLDGRTLSEIVATEGPMSPHDVAPIARQLIAGLGALHAAGIVHRDFKSSNVIVAGDRAVITDFGLARSLRRDRDASLTAESSLLGTPSYMSPEQVEGRDATPASDVYALGVVLFEMLTGVLPFRRDTALATAAARLSDDAPPPSSIRRGIPPVWDVIVARCLARDPSMRPRVADVLAVEVESRRWILGVAAMIVGGLGLGAWRLATHDVPALPAPARAAPIDLVSPALSADAVIAMYPVAPRGGDVADPWRIAISLDIYDALTSGGARLLAFDSTEMTSNIEGTASIVARSADPRSTAFALQNVAAVLELAITAPADPVDGSIEVDVTLARADGRPGWRHRIHRPASEALLLVEDVATAIAVEIGARPPRRAADATVLPAGLYHRYAVALRQILRHEGRKPLRDIVRENPAFARAAAYVADRLVSLAEQQDDARPKLAEVIEICDAALRADPEQPLALAVRGHAKMLLWDWDGADADTALAVERAPTHARVNYHRNFLLTLQARFDSLSSPDHFDPLSVTRKSTRTNRCYHARRYQECIDYAEPIVAAEGASAHPQILANLALSYAEMARNADALRVAALLEPTDDVYWLTHLVPVYVMVGETAKANDLYTRLTARDDGTAGAAAVFAVMDDAMGRRESALVRLEYVVNAHNIHAAFLKILRLSPQLRAEPRFQALMRRVGFAK
jgi:hypothetical protein